MPNCATHYATCHVLRKSMNDEIRMSNERRNVRNPNDQNKHAGLFPAFVLRHWSFVLCHFRSSAFPELCRHTLQPDPARYSKYLRYEKGNHWKRFNKGSATQPAYSLARLRHSWPYHR